MISAKLATSSLLNKALKINYYNVIFFVQDVTNKTLSRDLNQNLDVVMWPIFCNSRISIKEIILTSVFERFDQKKQF